jgi:hypothetical protein
MNEAGVLETQGDVISYRGPRGHWSLELPAIDAIGEVSNQSGPWGDDWFICFVTDRGGLWYEAPVEAEGSGALLTWLSAKVGETLEWRLANSTDFRSRVMWPTALRDQPLFEFVEPTPRSGLQRLARRFHLWPWSNEQRIDADVVRALRISPYNPPLQPTGHKTAGG